MTKIFSWLLATLIIVSGIAITFLLTQEPKLPNLDNDQWWGIGSKSQEEEDSIREFIIDFNTTMISELKERLRNRRQFSKPLEGIQSEYGINTIYLEKILNYWLLKYDFKQRANIMNKFNHFKTKIQGLDIHFIRAKPANIENYSVLPLLMLHGWPSSSKEFHKVIPMLTTPTKGFDFVFEVVAPDLPGFGFSEATSKPGLSPVHIGIMMRNLMRRLGFEKFYIQAGDWGSQCATHMATLFPDEILGFHTNMPLSSMPISMMKLVTAALFPRLIVDKRYEHRIYPLKDLLRYIMNESGYFHIQATKPDTIGVALTDSPAGLAAYIMEKMAICSNRDQLNTPHGGLENLSIEDVLDTITINWANSCIVTSMRIYAEGINKPEINSLHKIPTPVPTAAINFRYEVLYQPDCLLRDKFPNLVHSATHNFGGHFAAMQTPDTLVEDIFAAAEEFLKFHKRNLLTQTKGKWMIVTS